jgi:SAM-dependent methyltransferase
MGRMGRMGRMGQTGWLGQAKVVVGVYLAAAASLSARPYQTNPSAPSDLSDLQPPRGTPPTNPKGRLFRQQDLGLLEAPDRDQWQKADQIMDALAVAEGSVVADIGAAGGWFTLRLARRAGPNGLVYAEDIQPGMIEGIARRMQSENLMNVKTILGTPSDPRLPPGLDAAVIADAYHEMDDPSDPTLIVTLLQNIARSLKPQGRLGIVDWVPGNGGPGPPADQRVDPDAVIRAASAAGLRLVSREELPPFVLLLVFGRANGPSGPLSRAVVSNLPHARHHRRGDEQLQ